MALMFPIYENQHYDAATFIWQHSPQFDHFRTDFEKVNEGR